MDVKTAIKGRRTIRKFKPEMLPQNTVREILEEARWAPSWGNTQSWEFFVVTGDTLEKFKKANTEKILAGKSSPPEIPMPKEWHDDLNKRYINTIKVMLGSLTIEREDKAARNELYGKMYSLFGAPCLIVACLDKRLSIEYAMLDMGLIIQTICLLAHEKGLGTCIMASSIRYPELLRELLPIPDSKVIAMGIALGYPDRESPANNFERERAGLDELVTWVS
ncbi:MAG: nitroreductase [Pseudomonadota bacterium]